MRARLRLAPILGLLALPILSLALDGNHQARASWPPPKGATLEQLKDPANWPDDPGYGPRDSSGKPNLTGEGGQWQFWSFIPPRPGDSRPVRKGETATGMSIDVAWTHTIGDARVKIAVLDSGIEWENSDLVHKAALNAKELTNAMPLDKDGKACGGEGELKGFDCNGDGVFDLYDYEVSKKTSSGKDFYDANKNGILDPGDLITLYSDGKDDDGNGFVDDICGWDFFKDDNDPYDDTRYGHGTGEARDSTAETNNKQGEAGVCPKCRFIPLRVGDSFITDVNEFAQAVTYGADIGAKVIQSALGTINQSRLSRASIDYAYKKGLTFIASAADENSRHHNMPSAANHAIVVHAIQGDRSDHRTATTFLNFHSCSNYGGQVPLSASASGCASEATGNSSGIAGLIISMGLQRKEPMDLTGEEVGQLMFAAADLIDVPESYDPKDPGYLPSVYYPSKPTFSQRFGYGRQNAGKAVKMVSEGRIPPEVDLESPEWFQVLYLDDATTDIPLKGHISAKRAVGGSYGAVIEWAKGVDPDEGTWKTLSTIPSQPASKVLGEDGTPLGFLKLADIGEVNNPGEIENKYTITVRIRATAKYTGGLGDVKGETRKTFYIHKDATRMKGWPKYIGSSGEASPRLVDLDGDGKREILYPDADGLLHAWRADGTELPGWPFKALRIDGLREKEDSPFVRNYLKGDNAWTRGDMKVDLAREAYAPAAPAVADIDGDGKPEIFIGSWAGTIYGIKSDGTTLPGWPKRLPDVPSCPRGDEPKLPAGTPCMDELHGLARGTAGGVALVDMNKDGKLDVVVPAFDGKIYVFKTDGSLLDGWPVEVHYSGALEGRDRYSRVLTTPAIGDLNGDGFPDIAVGSNQYLGKGGNFGSFFVVDGQGTKAKTPYLPGWPVVVASFKLFPLVGEGIVSAGTMADIDGDGVPEVIFHGTGSTPVVLPANPTAPTVLGGAFPNAKAVLEPTFGELYESPKGLPGNNMIGVFSQPSIGDLDQDGKPDILALGANFPLALALSASERQEYEQQAAFWSGATKPCPDNPSRQCMFMFPGSPTIIEDYTFFHNGSVADIDGDDVPETIVGTGGYYLRAFNVCGTEAKEFPKFTGQWIIPTPTLGDIDGDGSLEVVTGTRNGFVYAWHTKGREDGILEWPTNHHDHRNTGNYATKSDFPKARKGKKIDVAALCKKVVEPTGDTGAGGGGGSGVAEVNGGGCGCAVPGKTSSTGLTFGALGLVGLGVGLRSRRRSR